VVRGTERRLEPAIAGFDDDLAVAAPVGHFDRPGSSRRQPGRNRDAPDVAPALGAVQRVVVDQDPRPAAPPHRGPASRQPATGCRGGRERLQVERRRDCRKHTIYLALSGNAVEGREPLRREIAGSGEREESRRAHHPVRKSRLLVANGEPEDVSTRARPKSLAQDTRQAIVRGRGPLHLDEEADVGEGEHGTGGRQSRREEGPPAAQKCATSELDRRRRGERRERQHLQQVVLLRIARREREEEQVGQREGGCRRPRPEGVRRERPAAERRQEQGERRQEQSRHCQEAEKVLLCEARRERRRHAEGTGDCGTFGVLAVETTQVVERFERIRAQRQVDRQAECPGADETAELAAAEPVAEGDERDRRREENAVELARGGEAEEQDRGPEQSRGALADRSRQQGDAPDRAGEQQRVRLEAGDAVEEPGRSGEDRRRQRREPATAELPGQIGEAGERREPVRDAEAADDVDAERRDLTRAGPERPPALGIQAPRERVDAANQPGLRQVGRRRVPEVPARQPETAAQQASHVLERESLVVEVVADRMRPGEPAAAGEGHQERQRQQELRAGGSRFRGLVRLGIRARDGRRLHGESSGWRAG